MIVKFINQVLRRKYYISTCECINLHFSDSGVFALNFTGDSSHSKEILSDILNTLNGFRTNIDEVELNRAKNILKRTILNNLSNQGDRMEETAKSVNITNIVQHIWKDYEFRLY
jgi:predicted Zn-dependent peptidase